MSKRAEERALKAYPIDMQPIRYQDYIDQFGGKTEIDVNSYYRRLFQEGYEQAEKDLGWHSVEESLPPVDEEVIVLADRLNLGAPFVISFGHIVSKMHCWDYNGWNIPGVAWWMPMPKTPNKDE